MEQGYEGDLPAMKAALKVIFKRLCLESGWDSRFLWISPVLLSVGSFFRYSFSTLLRSYGLDPQKPHPSHFLDSILFLGVCRPCGSLAFSAFWLV